jgi:type I restriction enzyme S subunit
MALDGLDAARVDMRFLMHFLRQRGFADVTTGASQPQIVRNRIVEVLVPLPPLPEQRRIAGILDLADSLRARRRSTIEHIGALGESIFVDMFDDQQREGQRDPCVPIGDVLTFVTSGSRGWARYYAPAGSRFIRSLDVRYNYVANESAVFVTPPDNAEARRTCVQEGDVLLTITGSRIGRVAPVPADLAGAYISQHVAILRLARDRILPRFLSYFLGMRTLGQRQIARAQYGQTKPGLNLTQIRDLEIPLPPLARQREFENALSAASALQNSQQEYLRVEDALQASLQDRAFRGAL